MVSEAVSGSRFTVHRDGSRIMRAQTEIEEGEVLRDVTYALGADWRPRHWRRQPACHGSLVGSGWFLFDEREATCETFTALEGRISQRVATAERVRAFGSHAITADGLMTAIFDLDGPKRQHFDNMFMSSYAFNGATGPMLLPISFGFDYLGIEEVEVPAGRFRCHRLRYVLEGSAVDGHPTYDNWVHCRRRLRDRQGLREYAERLPVPAGRTRAAGRLGFSARSRRGGRATDRAGEAIW